MLTGDRPKCENLVMQGKGKAAHMAESSVSTPSCYRILVLCLGVLIAGLLLGWFAARWQRAWRERPELSPEQAQAQLASLREAVGRPDNLRDAWAATWHARLDWLDWRLADLKNNWNPGAAQEIQRLTGELFLDSRQPARLWQRRQSFLGGFWSTLDDTVQTYSVRLPDEFNPLQAYPLVVSLHGQGMFGPFQGGAFASLDKIVIAPHGRGGMDYMWVAEPDIRAAIASVKRLFRIDEDRVFCYGHSMGGTGGWHLATRFPDEFAAIVAGCGNTDTRVWAELWNWQTPPESPQAKVRDFLRDDTGAVIYAPNLRNVHVASFQGDADPIVNVLHGEHMAQALAAAAHPSFQYHRLPFVNHGFGIDVDEVLAPYQRVTRPARVTFQTAWLRYEGSAWVRIRAMERRLTLAKVDAEARDNAFRVQTANVRALELIPAAAPAGERREVEIDGQRLPVADVAVPIQLVKTPQGRWELGTPTLPASGLAKTAAVEGPLEHVFMSRFLLVRPTGRSERALAAAAACDQFRAFWQQRFGKPPRVKDDTALTTEDVATSNLVLYGTAPDNRAAALVEAKLPLVLQADGRIQVGNRTYSGTNLGFKFCYPNPLNPARYVAVIAGATPESYADINSRFGNWFDWIPFDYRNHFDYAVFDDRTVGRAPETFLVWGFFGEDWGVDSGQAFVGDEDWRQRVRPRTLPGKLPEPVGPPPAELYLDSLPTISFRVEKEYVERNRNLYGEPLRLAGAAFARGLALRFPGEMTFANPFGHRRLRATVGLDWDGHTPRCADAEKCERAVFQVRGDGGRVLFTSGGRKYSDPPLELDVDLEGSREVTLAVWGGRLWLNGTAVWAMARFE